MQTCLFSGVRFAGSWCLMKVGTFLPEDGKVRPRLTPESTGAYSKVISSEMDQPCGEFQHYASREGTVNCDVKVVSHDSTCRN